jgi:hypothetical protein
MKPIIKTVAFSWVVLVGCDSTTAPGKESDMFFKPTTKHYVIASPMEGVLLKDGEPLANAKIIRTLRWNSNDEGVTSEFYTDDNGFFFLPVHEETLTLGKLTQFVASSELNVETSEGIVELWYNNKFSGELYEETDGPTPNLVCDIQESEIAFHAGTSKIMTRCRWEGMPEDYVVTSE